MLKLRATVALTMFTLLILGLGFLRYTGGPSKQELTERAMQKTMADQFKGAMYCYVQRSSQLDEARVAIDECISAMQKMDPQRKSVVWNKLVKHLDNIDKTNQNIAKLVQAVQEAMIQKEKKNKLHP